jgi:hypothetical protein
MNAEPSSKLVEVLGALAIELQARTDPAATLRGIVDASVDIVPGARWAGISSIQGRRVQSGESTDPIAAELDQLQTDLGEGPCISTLREHHTVQIDDMSTETRWPRFVRRASALGVRSMLSFQLFVRSQNLGALNLHGDAPGVFTDESLFVGSVLAQACGSGDGRCERRITVPRGPAQPRRHRSGQRHSDAPRQSHRVASIRGSDSGLAKYSGEIGRRRSLGRGLPRRTAHALTRPGPSDTPVGPSSCLGGGPISCRCRQ